MKLYQSVILLMGVVSCSACVDVASNSHGNRFGRHAEKANVADAAGLAEAQLRRRLVECALPWLAKEEEGHATIEYRYAGRRLQLSISDPDLAERLRACATPEDGPLVEFSGRITIWPQ